jgi:hypothetical protein
MTTKQIKTLKGSTGVGEGPLFEKVYEDHVGDAYNYYVSTQCVDGRNYTLLRQFGPDEKDLAERTAKAIDAGGVIEVAYWELGTPWDQYKIPQTYEEEKAEALEREHGDY